MCRTRRGLKQADLASKSGLSSSYISLIESGKREVSINVLRDIAVSLEIPTEILVFLGSDSSELSGLTPELRQRLSEAALTLLSEYEPNPLL